MMLRNLYRPPKCPCCDARNVAWRFSFRNLAVTLLALATSLFPGVAYRRLEWTCRTTGRRFVAWDDD